LVSLTADCAVVQDIAGITAAEAEDTYPIRTMLVTSMITMGLTPVPT